MNQIYAVGVATALKQRMDHLQPDSVRQWGTMTPAQALAHCASALEMALGERRPPRMVIGYLIGWVIKPLALGNDEPLRRNSPTVPGFAVTDQRHFMAEKARLLTLIDRFVQAGPQGCTTHPHGFFGRLTPEQWSVLAYKHLDHHLRQFGV